MSIEGMIVEHRISLFPKRLNSWQAVCYDEKGRKYCSFIKHDLHEVIHNAVWKKTQGENSGR